jgi:uracil phosphoribosyltransferase
MALPVVQSNHPLIRHKLSVLRRADTEPKKFRELVRELTWLLAYEALHDLPLDDCPIETPMGPTMGTRAAERVGLVPILRAGLGMVDAFLEVLPTCQVWHLGLYRDHKTLEPVSYYNKLPGEATVQVCLILDPMLATGGSAVAACDVLKTWGARKIKFVGLIAAPEGVRRLAAAHPDVDIHIAAVDERLNDKGYILPGLGDAGDRQFGTA